MKQTKKGFTLIELMIVVAIIAILAMIAVPMFQRYMERARNTASENLLHQLATSMTAYSVDSSTYLPTLAVNTNDLVGEALMPYGFRIDPNVAFHVANPTSANPGFIAFAAHRATGSRAYVYDNINGSGVMPLDTLTTTLAVGTGTPVAIDGTCPATLDLFIIDPANPTTNLLPATPATVKIGANAIVIP